MELKPAEVEYISNLNRCGLCDHLGAFHRDAGEPDDIEHCEFCEEDALCAGVSLYYAPECLIGGCQCTGFR